MYRLHTRPGSGGFVAEVAFALAGVSLDMVDVPKSEQPGVEFLKVSPLRQVPALTLPDGRSMTESAAICLLIAENYPEARLAPAVGSPGRVDFLRWMVFMSSVLYPALLRYFYASRYTADPNGVAAVKNAAVSEADRAFLVVEETLSGRDWLAGSQFSIADVYLLMLAYWHPVADRPRDEWTNIVQLCEKLKRQPVIAAMNARHRLW